MTLNLELSLSSELRGVHGREGNGQRLEDLSSEVCMAEGNGPRLEMWNGLSSVVHGREGNGIFDVKQL